MKRIIKITKKDYELSKKLIREHDKIYGEPGGTVWNFDDLERLRKIGENFIDIFREYLKNIYRNKK